MLQESLTEPATLILHVGILRLTNRIRAHVMFRANAGELLRVQAETK